MRLLLCLVFLTLALSSHALEFSVNAEDLDMNDEYDAQVDEDHVSEEDYSHYLHPTVRTSNTINGNPPALWQWGQIPYVLDRRFGLEARMQIFKAFFQFKQQTCINFHERALYPYRDYIMIYPGGGCFTDIGRVGGRQLISLDESCLNVSSVIHQLMHVIGFYHEHTRPDRNFFISILDENIHEEHQEDFDRREFQMPYDSLPYDYGSIMHLGNLAWSANNLPTLRVKERGATIGIRKEHTYFSETDLAKIRLLYECDAEHFKHSSTHHHLHLPLEKEGVADRLEQVRMK